MIPTDIEQRRKMISYMLEKCNDEVLKLNDWEQNFITSISEQYSIHMNLSDRQCEILERIYDKV